jgi:ATP-dependent RNA helicase DDX49/DBP8
VGRGPQDSEGGSLSTGARLSLLVPAQDPDLEARRKAELAKMKQRNRRFKDEKQRTLQRKKAGGAGHGGPRPKTHGEPSPAQGPA